MNNFAKWIVLVTFFSVLAGSVYAAGFNPLGGLSGGSGGGPSPEPQVYDLDDLTEGATQKEKEEEKPKEVKSGGNKTETVAGDKVEENSTEDELSLSIAECLIMGKLGIEDKKCDKIKQNFECPDYTTCINHCGERLNVCFGSAAKGDPGITGKFCRDKYNNGCTTQCAVIYKECGTKYPPDKLQMPSSSFELLDARGDVRITYDDNPRASDMKEIKSDGELLVGATIFTGDESGVTLRFSDESTSFVGPGAYFRIDDFYMTDKFEKGNMFLKKGQVRVWVNQFDSEKKKYAYVVMTPLWKAEVKGTELVITVDESGNASIKTISGKVDVLDFDDNLIASVGSGETYSSAPLGEEDPADLDIDRTKIAQPEEIYSYEDFLQDQKVKKWLYGLGALGAAVLIAIIAYFLKRRRR